MLWRGACRLGVGRRRFVRLTWARALVPEWVVDEIAFKGRLVQYAGRILRPYPGKDIVEVHDYHDADTGVLAASLAKRAPGYVSLGFPDPRRLQHLPPAAT